MTLLYENDLTKNLGGNNKHELALSLFLLLVILSEKIENEDEISYRTQQDASQKSEMKYCNR